MTSLLRAVDVTAVSAAARKESRNREVHLPPVSVYRWWARRTVAVNDAILRGVQPGVLVDPFSGGGVIPLAAIQRGWKVHAQDINPWAVHGLEVVLSLTDPERFQTAAEALRPFAEALAERAYGTSFDDGSPARVAHTFRVAVAPCPGCGESQRLFPHAMVSALRRKDRGGEPKAWLACSRGHLFSGRWDRTQECERCGIEVDPKAKYQPGRRVRCHCAHVGSVAERGRLSWEVVLVERAGAGRRELGIPTCDELERADREWPTSLDLGPISQGRETRVLRRHGFESWNDLYPARQRHVLEALLARTEGALRLAVVGSAEMAGHCSRWDRWYLKSFEAMAGHRFNFTTLTVEPNVWGTREAGRGTVRRRIRSFVKAAKWMSEAPGVAAVELGSSAHLVGLENGFADVVLTDPPYHDDVDYSALSLPLRAWAGLPTAALVGEAIPGAGTSYRALLAGVFAECRRVLKPGGHLIFSYANRDPDAWIDLFGALQDVGLHASGCISVHSENETDKSKRGINACTQDLLLDLTSEPANEVYCQVGGGSAEGDFLVAVAAVFGGIGKLDDDWSTGLRQSLLESRFLA